MAELLPVSRHSHTCQSAWSIRDAAERAKSRAICKNQTTTGRSLQSERNPFASALRICTLCTGQKNAQTLQQRPHNAENMNAQARTSGSVRGDLQDEMPCNRDEAVLLLFPSPVSKPKGRPW